MHVRRSSHAIERFCRQISALVPARTGCMGRVDVFIAQHLWNSHPGATLREIEAATPWREAIWAQLCWISDELEDLGAPGATDHDVLFKLMARMLSIC